MQCYFLMIVRAQGFATGTSGHLLVSGISCFAYFRSHHKIYLPKPFDFGKMHCQLDSKIESFIKYISLSLKAAEISVLQIHKITRPRDSVVRVASFFLLFKNRSRAAQAGVSHK